MTLSIPPSRPDTGYGYIEISDDVDEIKKVKSFKEKPDLSTAELYLSTGNYAWNSGMFIWKTSTIIDAFKKYAVDIYDMLTQESHRYYTHTEQDYIDEVYPATRDISIDYAIIEKADNVYTLPSAFGWSDLGTWASLYDFLNKNENNNVIIGNGNFVLNESSGCLIKSKEGKKILVRGLKDYIIVDEEEALLLYPINKEQDIKADQKKF
jgi:mannose-1-phosphate guanylyltransferase